MSLIQFMILGIVAGWLAGIITGTHRSIWGDFALGLVGALVARLVVRGSVADGAGFWLSLVAATIAAVILVFLKNMLVGRRPW